MKIATAKDRLSAFFINLVILVIVTSLLSKILTPLINLYIFKTSVINLSKYIAVLLILINAYIQGKTGSDIGKWFCGLKIIDYHNNRDMGFWMGICRGICAVFSILIFGLGSLAMLFNAERLTMHDMFFNSLVIEANNYPRQNILNKALRFIIFLIACTCLSVIIIALLVIPLVSYNNYSYNRYRPIYDIPFFANNSGNDTQVPISNNQLSALVKIYGLKRAEYMDFEIKTESELNYISINTLKELNIPLRKAQYHFKYNLDTIPPDFKSQPYLVAQEFIMQNQNKNDFKIKNLVFHLHNGPNIIGNDIFSMLKTKFTENNSMMNFSLNPTDKGIIVQNYEDKTKLFLIKTASDIIKYWNEVLIDNPIESVITDTDKENNPKDKPKSIQEIEFIYHSRTGNLEDIKLINPIIIPNYQKFLTKFGEQKNLRCSLRIPDELRAKEKFSLNMFFEVKPQS